MSDIPITIPRGWALTTISAVASQQSGDSTLIKGTLSKTPDSGLFPAYSASGQDVWRTSYEDTGEAIIISAVGARCGKVFKASGQWSAIANTHIVKIDSEAADFRYFYYLLNREHFRVKSGTAQPFVKVKATFERPFLLPPLPEQRRIVAKIEELFSELDKGIENLKQARAQLAVYRQALLKHAFEGKLTADWRAAHPDQLESADQLLARIRAEREARSKQNSGKTNKPRKSPEISLPSKEALARLPELPLGWAWLRLGSCNVEIFDGPFGSHLKSSDYTGSCVRVVRLENIGVLNFIEEKKSYVSEAKYKTISEHTVYPGDIVFSSFITERTRMAMVPPSVEKAVNKADCFCVRCHGTGLPNRYACVYLSTRFAYKQLEATVHGIGRPRINTTQLKELFVPLCSPSEQRAVMDKIDGGASVLDGLEADIETNLQKAGAMRQSILKKAFSGELVPQDPDDEPASALLARIRAEREAASAKPARRQARLSPSAPSA